jgi:cobalt-zinc-cadmium efflux system membrane fusion protein
MVEIAAGLLPGEIVAAANSGFLRSELLKNNLGEGCACCAGK